MALREDVVRDAEARTRVLAIRKVLRRYRDHLWSIMLVAVKRKDGR